MLCKFTKWVYIFSSLNAKKSNKGPADIFFFTINIWDKPHFLVCLFNTGWWGRTYCYLACLSEVYQLNLESFYYSYWEKSMIFCWLLCLICSLKINYSYAIELKIGSSNLFLLIWKTSHLYFQGIVYFIILCFTFSIHISI